MQQATQNQIKAKENTIKNIETEPFLNYYPYGTTETNFIDGQTNVNCSLNCKKTKKQSLSSPCRGYVFFKGGMNGQ